MTQKSSVLLMIVILSGNLVHKAEATTAAKVNVFAQHKLKRAIVSFLDPHSLGRIACSTQDFRTIVECMDYYKENKEFLKTIRDIEVTLSELEFSSKNEEENQEIIEEHSEKLTELMWSLYPHVQLACEKPEGNRLVPCYNPEFYGNKARDQALAKTMIAQHKRLQELFIRHKSLNLSSLPDAPVVTSNLADRESIIAGIPDHQKNFERLDETGSWIRNPNISPHEYKALLGSRCEDFYTHCSIDWILANPTHSDKTIENFFIKVLEITEENAKRKKAHLRAATGIALNPVAVKKFGERLLDWIISNEDIVVNREMSGENEDADFPMTSLMYNANLTESVSERLADYLLTSLKHFATLLTDEHPPDLAQASKIKTFADWLIKFAKTAHGSVVIIKKLGSILSDNYLIPEFKETLIESLFEGFDWSYYFENYSIDDDVKRPFQLPEKLTLAITRWLSQEGAELDEPNLILQKVISRGVLNSEAIHRAIDVVIANPNKELQAKQLLELIENCHLYEEHYQRIRVISEFHAEELKTKMLEAIDMMKNEAKS